MRRLYPKDQSPETLERLAKVPPGTFKRLSFLRDVLGPYSDEYYGAVFNDPHLNALDNFVTRGWGALTQSASLLAGSEYAGSATGEEANALLRAQGVLGVDAASIGGGVWWG